MPKRKSYAGRSGRSRSAKFRRRKIYRVKRRYLRRKRLPLGFPQSYTARLKYVTTIDLNPDGATHFDEHLFRANDLRDPDYSGVGHQPKSFDEYMALYRHFTVIGSKIKVTPLKVTGNNVTNSMLWGVVLAGATNDVSLQAVGGNFASLLESRMIGSRRVRTAGMVYNLNNRSETCTTKFSAKKFYKKKAIVGDSLYRGNTSTSPTEDAFFTIWGCPPDGSSDSDAQSFLVEIEYIAVFTEPVPLSQS